jgi:hypothetical protein
MKFLICTDILEEGELILRDVKGSTRIISGE